MLSQAEIRQQITQKIVEALKRGVVPWRRPWRSNSNSGTPSNAVSSKAYRGINILLLGLAALEHGYESRFWGSYRQWQTLGGQVRRGEHGTQIVFYRPVVRRVMVDENGEERVDSFPILRTWTVFNVAQVEGDAVEQFRSPQQSLASFVDYSPAEEVIAATGADIRYVEDDKAFYQTEGDYIQLPPKSWFDSENDFYRTACMSCRIGVDTKADSTVLTNTPSSVTSFMRWRNWWPRSGAAFWRTKSAFRKATVCETISVIWVNGSNSCRTTQVRFSVRERWHRQQPISSFRSVARPKAVPVKRKRRPLEAWPSSSKSIKRPKK